MSRITLTYKNRYRIALSALIILSLFVIRFGLLKTYSMYLQLIENKNKSLEISDAPDRIHQLKDNINNFETMISGDSNDSTATRNIILNHTSTFCKENDLSLISFRPPISTDKGSFILETNQVEVEGTFHNALKLAYQLEVVWKPGKVVSLHFRTIEDLKTKSVKLLTYVYIQKVKPKA